MASDPASPEIWPVNVCGLSSLSAPVVLVKVTVWSLIPLISIVAPAATVIGDVALAAEDTCAVPSTATTTGVDMEPVMSDESVSAAVKLLAPFGRVLAVNVQTPAAFASEEPSGTLPFNTSTTLCATATPVSVATSAMPVFGSRSFNDSDVISGAVPACASTDTVSTVETVLVFPFESIAVAVKLCAPSANIPVAKLQKPLASVSVEPRSTLPSNKLTTL